MRRENSILINDDLFRKTISCPLKFYHILGNEGKRNSSDLLFRQRNKLHVRDAIAFQFQACKYTSNAVSDALKETAEWLRQDSIAICGAVIQHENLLTRIPILAKEGDKLIIIQAHGRLRKRSDGDKILPTVQKRSTLNYLLKAAYRLEVLKRKFPKSTIEVLFYFPNKHFKASSKNLHLFHQEQYAGNKKLKEEFSELFSRVNATEAVQHVHQHIPDAVAHKSFEGFSVTKAIEKIAGGEEDGLSQINVEKHGGCKYCEFRLPEKKGREGCWEQFFSSEGIRHSEKHIFELIGHGNAIHSENGVFYQEETRLSKGGQSFENILQNGGPTITILQRRNLQILKAKNQPVPKLWIKPGIKSVRNLKYPLHFLDFEAATFAIPMKDGVRPYDPAYFQFSCHTLYEDGKLVHSEWLDLQPGAVHPHREFVNQLGEIPDFFQGTIMQYSPFEKQGVNRLLRDLSRNPENNTPQIEMLKKIKESELIGYENRFFDVSKMIRDYYYNHFFEDGLGVKQVLSSILKWEQSSVSLDIQPIEIDDTIIHIAGEVEQNGKSDPYMNFQESDLSIADGSAAMNAWLCLKNDLVKDDEKSQIQEILRSYCALDSYALVVIYKHLERFLNKIDQKDLIEF